ncbi:phage tail protein [Clostridium butyricum]|uniref:phage tail protein n=1 Tax=Clostridium butyricum TaxID=1492 RepID=UPI003D326481
MSKIGNLGKQIVFKTSDKKILTFNDFKQSVSGRWAVHERIGEKPRSEFIGPGLRSISFTIVLSASNGVRPRKTLEKIEKMIEEGTVEYLIIGGKKVGNNKWKISDMSETWDVIYSKGQLARATASITLEEYI